MKPTKRHSFLFQRSYFDVMNKLTNDSDRLLFLEAVINKSFLDEDPKDLPFIVDLSYESQRHFIEKSIKGWKSVKKTDLLGDPIDPSVVPPLGDPIDPTLQVQVEVQVEVEDKEDVNTKLNFVDLLHFLNTTLSKQHKVINTATRKKYLLRIKEGYTLDDIQSAILNASISTYHKESGFQYLTPEFFSRADKIEMYLTNQKKSSGYGNGKTGY